MCSYADAILKRRPKKESRVERGERRRRSWGGQGKMGCRKKGSEGKIMRGVWLKIMKVIKCRC